MLAFVACTKTNLVRTCPEIPYQYVYLREITPRTADGQMYRVTRFYTACSDEWQSVPMEARDDLHVFSSSDNWRLGYRVRRDPNTGDPDTLRFQGMFYYNNQVKAIAFDWMDFSGQPYTYQVEELRYDQIIMSKIINGKKHYLEFSKQYVR